MSVTLREFHDLNHSAGGCCMFLLDMGIENEEMKLFAETNVP
jgi:hypothetical protein